MSEQLKQPNLQVDLKNTTAFEDENGNVKNSAMRPSMLVIFRKKDFI